MRQRSAADIARTRAFWLANKPGESPAPALTPDAPAPGIVALALVAALGIQASFAPFLAFREATPSLVTLVVAWYASRTGVAKGLAFGLFAGACEDALAGATGVAWTFATGVAGALAGRLARTWFGDTTVVLVPAIAILTFVRFVVFAVAISVSGHTLVLGTHQVHVALWQSALDAAVVYAVLVLGPAIGAFVANRR